jgi:CRISPR-associated endoribonuclease Cas6
VINVTDMHHFQENITMLSIDILLHAESPVPYNYQYELYSAIQSGIRTRNPNISTLIHNSRGVSLLNMSALLPLKFEGVPRWQNARMFALVINTIDPDVADAVSAVLTPGTSLRLNSCMFNVHSTKRMKMDFKYVPSLPELKGRGPIVIREKGKYYRVGDREFELHLSSALKRKADAVTGRNTVVRGLTIDRGRAKVYQVGGHNVPASILSFILDADEDVIRTALIYGVGSKTQMGFGMVTVGEQ